MNRNTKVIAFFLKALGLFFIWFILEHCDLLNTWAINSGIIGNLVSTSEFIMNAMGFKMVVDGDNIGLLGGARVHIGNPCNALDLMYLFSALILLLPGRIKNKFIFITVGLILIHAFNIFRVVVLIYLANYYPNYLEFNHSYTFTLFVYVMIFGMWILWNQKFAFYPNLK